MTGGGGGTGARGPLPAVRGLPLPILCRRRAASRTEAACASAMGPGGAGAGGGGDGGGDGAGMWVGRDCGQGRPLGRLGRIGLRPARRSLLRPCRQGAMFQPARSYRKEAAVAATEYLLSDVDVGRERSCQFADIRLAGARQADERKHETVDYRKRYFVLATRDRRKICSASTTPPPRPR